ncbi:MAG TPA: ATP-binding protein [Verrucomicrobiae bacterium]
MLLPRSLATVLLLATLCISRNVFAQSGAAVITNALEILRLAPAEARENRPVRLRAVVTCYIPESQLCFVQDESAGIYVQPAPWPKELPMGQVVEVQGRTAQGRFSPIVEMGTIRTTEEKRSITPRRISLEELNTGRFDCQFVEVEAVVQSAVAENNVVKLEVATGDSVMLALIFSLENAPTNTVDARVRLRGIAGTFYAADRLSGFGLFLPNATFLEVVRRVIDPFEQRPRAIANLAGYSPEGGMDHRTRVRGTVSFVWRKDFFFLQDESGSLLVDPRKNGAMPAAGDAVEVAGFVRNPVSMGTTLKYALWKKIGTTNLSALRPVQLGSFIDPPRGQRLAIEGTVVAMSSTGGVTTVILNDDGQAMRVLASGSLSTDLIGSTVRARGVFSLLPKSLSAFGEPALLAQADEIEVLRAGRAAIVPQQSSKLLLAAMASLALVLAAFAWSTHKASKNAQELASSASMRLGETEKEISQLKDSRERLGRDLHDHIIQSIYAVGLGLEDCKQALADPTKVEPRLKSALNGINDVIRELRSVISGLETNVIQPREFRTALKSLALMLGHENSSRLRLELDERAIDALTPPQATELVHIAREALSNAIRHGHAETTTVALHQQNDSLRFAVEDDGKGFNVQAADTKGYGLRNMAKRAENLGAKFTIQAQEGLGTRILLDIPKQKQHFST